MINRILSLFELPSFSALQLRAVIAKALYWNVTCLHKYTILNGFIEKYLSPSQLYHKDNTYR